MSHTMLTAVIQQSDTHQATSSKKSDINRAGVTLTEDLCPTSPNGSFTDNCWTLDGNES